LQTAFVLLAAIIVLGVAFGVLRLRRYGFVEPVVDEALIERLLQDPVFAPLSAPTVERLAQSAARGRCNAGEHLVVQGDDGDHYYLIGSGTVQVVIDGIPVRQLGPGSSFGEIALLRDIPRTATVTALEPVEAILISRDTFLEAVTGHPRSFRLATQAADDLLS